MTAKPPAVAAVDVLAVPPPPGPEKIPEAGAAAEPVEEKTEWEKSEEEEDKIPPRKTYIHTPIHSFVCQAIMK